MAEPVHACCSTPRSIAHRGEGPALVVRVGGVGRGVGRRAPGPARLPRAAAHRHRRRTSQGGTRASTACGSDFEGALLDALAVIEMSSNRRLRDAATALRRGGGDGLLVAVLGSLDLEETRLLARLRHGSTAAVAILLDTAHLEPRRPTARAGSRADDGRLRPSCCARPAGGCCGPRPATRCPTCGADAGAATASASARTLAASATGLTAHALGSLRMPVAAASPR